MVSREEFDSAVIVRNVRDKKLVLEFGKKYLLANGYGKKYRIENSQAAVKFIVNSSKIAYSLMKEFEQMKLNDENFSDIDVQFTMNNYEKKRSNSKEMNYNYSYGGEIGGAYSPRVKKVGGGAKKRKNSPELITCILKDEEYDSVPYYHRHMLDISSKAGLMNRDSPYITEEELFRKQEREKRKGDISKQRFSISTKIQYNDVYNRNEPFKDAKTHNFRPDNKDNWISKRGFKNY